MDKKHFRNTAEISVASFSRNRYFYPPVSSQVARATLRLSPFVVIRRVPFDARQSLPEAE